EGGGPRNCRLPRKLSEIPGTSSVPRFCDYAIQHSCFLPISVILSHKLGGTAEATDCSGEGRGWRLRGVTSFGLRVTVCSRSELTGGSSETSLKFAARR